MLMLMCKKHKCKNMLNINGSIIHTQVAIVPSSKYPKLHGQELILKLLKEFNGQPIHDVVNPDVQVAQV